jgi:hypothetical protein
MAKLYERITVTKGATESVQVESPTPDTLLLTVGDGQNAHSATLTTGDVSAFRDVMNAWLPVPVAPLIPPDPAPPPITPNPIGPT